MYDAVLGSTLGRIPGHTLYRLRTPECAYVAEDLGGVSDHVPEQHREAVEVVVLRRNDKRLPDSVPVEGGVQYRLEEVSVGKMVGPLPLPLEPARDCVVPERLPLDLAR